MQKQTLLSLQKLETKQSVVNSLGMFLAIAEGYLIANGLSINPIFSYYDHFNVTSERPELIKIKLMNNYMVYSAQKQNYLNEFRSFDFYPDNFSNEQIKNIIQKWIPYATAIKEKELYMNILNLFNDSDTTSNINNYLIYQNIQEFKANNPQSNIPMDPRNQVKAIANIQSHKEEENRRNRENWNNTGNHEINLVLNGKAGTSSLSKKMKTITNKSEKEIKDENKYINDMANLALELVGAAKILCEKDKKEEKRNYLNDKIKETKKKIDIFKEKFGSLEPLWEKIKYETNIKKPLNELKNNNCDNDDKKIFKKIDDLFNTLYL